MKAKLIHLGYENSVDGSERTFVSDLLVSDTALLGENKQQLQRATAVFNSVCRRETL